MKTKEQTDLMSFGDCSFQITTANEMMLSALSKYAQFLDYKMKYCHTFLWTAHNVNYRFKS